MAKFANLYPQIRLAVYGILTAVLGAAALFGLVSQDETEAYLGYAAAGLGAFGTLLALVNVKTAAPSVDAPTIADEVAARVNVGVQQAQTVAADTVADLRRRAEQELGHRLGG